MLTLFSLLIPSVHAEAPAAASGTVTKVVIAGLRRVDEAAILDTILLRAGEPLEEWKLQRDIRAIWKTGFVQDVVVSATADPMATGGVIVTFTVGEKPSVREIRITGAKKIKEDDLREVIDIEPSTVPSEARLQQNLRSLRDKYLEKGYYLVKVDPVMKPVGDDQVELTFAITENRKVVVQKIDITGNVGVPDRKIRRYMQTKQGGVLPWLTNSGTFIEENLDNDVYVARSVLLEEGYVDAEVDAPKVFLSPNKRYINVDIHVTEGQRYRLGAMTVSGDFNPDEGLTEGAVRALIEGKSVRDVQVAFEADKRAGRTFDANWSPTIRKGPFDFSTGGTPLKTGDWFKLTSMQGTTERISNLYGDQGYAFANIVPLPNTNPEAGVVDLHFELQRGEKMRIGRINITGNDPTFDKVVRREIALNEGDTYKGSMVKDAKARLERLGFFETVETSTPRGAGDNVLDLNVDVKERPTGSFSVGAGYGSADSFLFSANIQKSNFLGLGYLMSVAGNFSSRTRQANVSFEDPHFLDSSWTLRVDGYYNQQSYIEDEYQRGGTFQVGRYLDKRDDVRLAMDYTLEDVGLISIDEYKQRLYGGQLYRNGLTSSVGATFSIDKRNNRINATKGFLTSVKTELAGGFRLNDQDVLSLFGGDFNFWETKFNFRFYQPVTRKGDWLVFRYNLSLGRIQSTDNSIIPYIHRYRAGGILSVRGYESYSLGPYVRATGYRDYTQKRTSFFGMDNPTSADDRLVIGGTETWVNNFELEAAIVKSAGISAVAFVDAGNTFGDVWGQGHMSPLDLRWSYGLGVRWFSPIGPLRFEYGFPVFPEPDERKSVFEFTIGSAF